MAVMIGIDPHKGSHTAVAVGAAEEPLGKIRIRACPAQAEQLVTWAAGWPERTWAVEGAPGLGRLLGQQLVTAGERVLDVQPKLGARVRLLATGASGKNDPNNARSVAIAALRSKTAAEVAAADHAAVLKVWSKRHRDLSRARNQVVCRLHAVLCDLVPGGFGKEITAGQAFGLLQRIRPSGAVAQARYDLASEFVEDLRHLDAQLRDTRNKLAAAVQASGTSVTEIFGVGPIIAATVIGAVGQVARFATATASPPATAPPRSRCPPASGKSTGCRGAGTGASITPSTWPRSPRSATTQRGPRLLRPQVGRGQDPQRGAPLPQAPRQQRRLRPPARRRQANSPGPQSDGPGGQPGNAF